MSLGDPAQVFMRDCFFTSQSASEDDLHCQLYLHVAACVDAGNELHNATKERVSCAWHRLEAYLLASHVCSVQELESFLIDVG